MAAHKMSAETVRQRSDFSRLIAFPARIRGHRKSLRYVDREAFGTSEVTVRHTPLQPMLSPTATSLMFRPPASIVSAADCPAGLTAATRPIAR